MKSNVLGKAQILPATILENYEPNQYYKDIETTICQSEVYMNITQTIQKKLLYDQNRVLPFLPRWAPHYVMH